MDTEGLEHILKNEKTGIWVSILIFVVSLVVLLLLYRYTLRLIRKRLYKSQRIGDFIVGLLKVPLLWTILWILLRVLNSTTFLSRWDISKDFGRITDILVILSVGWIVIKVVRIVFYYLEQKLNITAEDNLNARKDLTKMKLFEGLIVTLIALTIAAVCLMTFERVRTIGVSLLTSAGIAGIVIGFAAQKSIATILAGIQIAITQPIRLDDVVIVEGEWGRIEEITFTYVVIRIWDERRLIVPVNYFLEKPFQNWTRTTSTIMGTVFLYVDYSLPVEPLRRYLEKLLKDHPKWDQRVANIQVTNTQERYKELRVLLSSRSSSFNWDLRVDIREKMIDYINREYPDSFVRVRVEEWESREKGRKENNTAEEKIAEEKPV